MVKTLPEVVIVPRHTSIRPSIMRILMKLALYLNPIGLASLAYKVLRIDSSPWRVFDNLPRNAVVHIISASWWPR